MSELTTLQEKVEKVLRECAQARDNNNILIYALFKQYGVSGTDNFASVMLKMINKELPSFESITRARRKVVELYPELDASASVKALRKQAEEEYKEYARV